MSRRRRHTADADADAAATDGAVIKEYASRRDADAAAAAPVAVHAVAAAAVAAGATHFVARGGGGAVWTWGDARFAACLGRGGAAGTAGEVTGLGGRAVVEVAAGGYAAAALTADGECYVWGSGAGFLTAAPTPLRLDAPVLGVGLGEDHGVVVARGGRVWAVGDNGSGQLGLGDDARVARLEDWTRVDVELPPRRTVVGVAAAPRASFLLVRVCDP